MLADPHRRPGCTGKLHAPTDAKQIKEVIERDGAPIDGEPGFLAFCDGCGWSGYIMLQEDGQMKTTDEWEDFIQPGGRQELKEPAVAIQGARLVLNVQAVALLPEGCEFVRLRWNARRRQIGVLPAGSDTPARGRCKLSKTGLKEFGKRAISAAPAFYKDYGIVIDKRILGQYPVTVVEGMLVIQLPAQVAAVTA